MKKLLTIYIPSYNRGKSILRQLEAINCNMSKEIINVIVNDNCSTDIEYKNVEKYCLEHKYIYHKNHFNIGPDANIFNGFMEFYRSEYIWILSDDDLLTNEAVLKVITILKNNRLDILLLTHSKIEKLETNRWSQKDFYEQNIKTADGAGLISNVIYNSSFIKESIPIGYQNIYTCFAHLSILIHSFKNKEVLVGRISSYNFFLPDTAMSPADPTGYDRSFFGFVLLGEQFENKNKKIFINEWTSFWYLRHWYKKSKAGEPNSIFAKCYINNNKKILNFFITKLFFWKLFTPIFLLIKKVLTKEKKDNLLKLLRVKS